MTISSPTPALRSGDPDALAHETLRLLGPDPANWVPDRDGIDHNVLVVGGGHSGSTFAFAFAFALRRAGIGKVTVIDRAADEDSSGIWRTIARMNQLRTPKTLVGPELGHVGLSFQSWFEARHGGAFVSSGLPVGDVPSFRREIPTVVAGISRDLFLADLDFHEQKITATVAPDFDLSLYGGALFGAPAAAAE